VQDKIAAAKSGDTITLDAGLYEEQIKLKDGVNLKAAEPGKVIIQASGKSGAALMVEGCSSGSVSGITFQHSGSDVAEEKSWPVALVKSSAVKIEDCTFRAGIGDGVSVTGAGRPTFTRCTFSNNRKNGITLESGSTAWVSACTAQKNGASGAEIRFVGTAPTLSAGTFSDNNDSGITVKDAASAVIQDAPQCAINGEAGIAAAGEGVILTLTGAVCAGNKLGITVQDRAKAQVRGCTVRDSKEMGIHLAMAATGCEISGNTVEKSSIYGILVTGAPGATATIAGNTVRNSALCGILVVGEAFAPVIEKNQTEMNGEFGILVADGAGGRVHDNICRGNTRGPISQQNAGKDLVIENNVTD
jgi:parallel beta-helix repeat protein